MKRVTLAAAAVFVGLLISALGADPALNIQPAVKLNWPTINGDSYQVQWTVDLGITWINLGAVSTGDGAAGTLYDSVPNGARSYRVLETTPGGAGNANALSVTSEPAAWLTWSSAIGTQYQPESLTDLTTGSWASAAPLVVGDGGIKQVFVDAPDANTFIRLRMPVVPLFDSQTPLEPAITVDTPTALITNFADRARDRHAREANYHIYDHYLSWYWEERTIGIQITDHVAKGGTGVTFTYDTLTPLGAPEFRAFFRGINTVAEYQSNYSAPLIAPDRYSETLTNHMPENKPLKIGDRIEVEISQFIKAPMHGRNNYYGTVFLYIVGQGVVPWQEGQEIGLTGGIVGNVNQNLDSYPLPQTAWLGGTSTLPYQYSNEPDNRFKQTAANISPMNAQPFMLGRRLHHTDFGTGVHSESGNPVFTEQIGKLGPKFTGRSCISCHVNNGRALPPAVGALMLQSVVRVGANASGAPHPTLGSVLQPQTTSGAVEGSATISSYTNFTGQYADGTTYSLRKPNYTFQGTTPAFFSVRTAPQLVGLALLEAVSESTILGLVNQGNVNQDGIHGHAQIVTDPETGEQRLGRFGSKAGKAKIKHQVAGALNTDMGVTTSIFPILDGETTGGTPELADSDLDEMTRYASLIGVSARRSLTDSQALRGEQLFANQCARCHVPTLVTSSYHPMAEVRNQTIHPYTDLLLHDMGSGLADNMGEGTATGAEWRTPPLWNIGLTAGVSGGEAYLHDGRARTLEEAILWHGGEGEAAKAAFLNLPAADRTALITFLKSL